VNLARFDRTALMVGAAGLAICIIGALISGAGQLLQSYLVGVLFWLGIAFGCLGIQMIHMLSGGAWGVLARRPLFAASATMPLCALLFAPLLAGLTRLYPWARAEVIEHDAVLQHKAAYLNAPFFVVRAILYFAVWSGLALTLYRRAARRADRERASRSMRMIAGPGVLAAGLTMTFASVDWLMSLDPHWTSTMFGLLVIVGSMLSGMAFTIVAVTSGWWRPSGAARAADDADAELPIGALHDLGNLMLVFVLVWAYFSFSQYLIVYAGNLAEETPWYIHRSEGGWQHVSLALIVLHFAVPFAVLLTRRTKRSPKALRLVALGILAMRLVELFWFVAPNFYGHHLRVHFLDIAAPIGLGGLWLFWFSRRHAAFGGPRAGATAAAASAPREA
jgi:hypothetical protein